VILVTKDEYYLGIALAVAKKSPCLKKQYGAVIVNNEEIISTGYNGPVRGESHCSHCTKIDCNKDEAEYLTCRSVHAEQNAIISASRKEMLGSTLYLAGYKTGKEAFELQDVEPCEICLRLIKNAGINKIVTNNGVLYIRDQNGILRRN
jgi:dCMP deaminase